MKLRLHREIDKLKKNLLTLCARVEEAVHQAVRSIETRDEALATKVINSDHEIDDLEVEIEEECLKIIALYQPVATDLRFIIATLKINNDLERIADLAVTIADHSLYFASRPQIPSPFDFLTMASKTRQMLRNSLNALVEGQATLAKEVCEADDEIDEINRRMYRQVEEAMKRNPDRIETLMHYIGVSRCLERMADNVTNIAEDVIYLIDGTIVRHKVAQYIPSVRKEID